MKLFVIFIGAFFLGYTLGLDNHRSQMVSATLPKEGQTDTSAWLKSEKRGEVMPVCVIDACGASSR